MADIKLETIEHRTLKDVVAATLRKAILEGKLEPGQPLVQDQIAKELNISRMPVREALNLLESEGLIVNLPYRGSVVARFTAQDIREIYKVRELLEVYATRQAARNITPNALDELSDLMNQMAECLKGGDQEKYASLDRRYHQLIFESSGNNRLVQLINQIWKGFPLYLAYSIPGRIERSHAEQTKVLDAIRQGDAEMAAHYSREQIKAIFKEMEPHFEDEAE